MTGETVQVDRGTLRQWQLPAIGNDKESRGRVLVVGGTARTPGAVLLAGEAALRVGAGKLQVATAPETSVALAVQMPEAGVRAFPHPAISATAGDSTDALDALAAADVVLVGPGVSDVEAAVDLVAQVLDRLGDEALLVVDALASAFLTERPDGLGRAAARTVLTVNPTELARVLHASETDLGDDLGAAASEVARRTGAVVLCGGEGKDVAAPDGRRWHAAVGCPGLGISGSGDVQAGIVAGLLARSVEPAHAAIWAGYLHGTAGERLASGVGPVGFLAREIPSVLPGLLAELGGA